MGQMLFESVLNDNQKILKLKTGNALIGSYMQNDKWSNSFSVYNKQIINFDTETFKGMIYCLVKTGNGNYEVITKSNTWEKYNAISPNVLSTNPDFLKMIKNNEALFGVLSIHTSSNPVLIKKRLDIKDDPPNIISHLAGPLSADIYGTAENAVLIYSPAEGGITLCRADLISHSYFPQVSLFTGAFVNKLSAFENNGAVYFSFTASGRMFLCKADSSTLVLKKTYDVAPKPEQWVLLPERLLLLSGNVLTTVDPYTLKITKREIQGQNASLGTVKINTGEICPAVMKESQSPTLL
ncbi:hypothetical protein SDC9_101469 [bioreactor metagenome]|uniref:Uncharacterized protein n=1 Tax=bioreactor metagenome TaxID=1076179 RepID=A0A645ANL9_9ZZZZ